MNLYTLEEANVLIDYYADKVTGRIFEHSNKTEVTIVAKEHMSDNQYMVIVYGTPNFGDLTPKKCIDIVADDLALFSPCEVISQYAEFANSPAYHSHSFLILDLEGG